MALNGTTLQHTHDRFLFEWSHGTYTATGSHDFFGETRYEPSKMKIRSTPTPLNTAQQQPVSPTEQFFADRSYGRWIGKEGPSPSTPPPRPLNNPQLVPVPPMEQLCEDLSDGRTWIRANEPSPNRNHTTAAMLNTAQQQPVTPTEQFFEDRSYDGTRIRAQVPSPASSFDSGELAEDYWEPDWPAPTNDAGSPTEDRLEPDWSPAMEPDPTAPTATETAQERWDHWPADKQEL
ncbi:hypothetical protein B9Z55_008757 [Caenorhabditis nigoni]|nr:hypothetical protein B9Z55_008757 [Caenorhabditis nigoni]